MRSLRQLARRYPNRTKYLLIMVNIIAMIVAIRVYVNYLAIETAIEDATNQQIEKTDELNFAQNFLLNYEKSDYAKYFLEHENNMLMPGDFIIKFEDMYAKQAQTGDNQTTATIQNAVITSPQQSRIQFILEKLR